MSLTLNERQKTEFLGKIDRNGPNGCWLWNGSVETTTGYGRYQRNGHRAGAHRVAYELLLGPIPPGLQLDHLCRTPLCVNPAHLEPVTHAENVRRAGGVYHWNSQKTHCSKGHPFNEANTYLKRGKRHCRACNSRLAGEYRQRKEAKTW